MYLACLPGGSGLPPTVAARIANAFERGSNHGLLHLGAVELASWLPPSLAFGREFAHLFMARWCAVFNLATQWVGDVQAWLQRKHPGWNLLGRVCFHLAENKNNPQAPFAFRATYAARVSQQSRVQHQPLGRALQEYAGAGDRDTLLGLLLPVNKAAEQSPWLKSLVDSGAIFHPIAWTPADAHQFLGNIPVFESCGIVVRIPDWWNPQQPPRRRFGTGCDAGFQDIARA